jgi:hypothetical protein
VLHYIDVELALHGEAGKRQIAAADEPDLGVHRIWSMKKVKLGMKRMPQEELYDDLTSTDLTSQTPKSGFILI